MEWLPILFKTSTLKLRLLLGLNFKIKSRHPSPVPATRSHSCLLPVPKTVHVSRSGWSGPIDSMERFRSVSVARKSERGLVFYEVGETGWVKLEVSDRLSIRFLAKSGKFMALVDVERCHRPADASLRYENRKRKKLQCELCIAATLKHP